MLGLRPCPVARRLHPVRGRFSGLLCPHPRPRCRLPQPRCLPNRNAEDTEQKLSRGKVPQEEMMSLSDDLVLALLCLAVVAVVFFVLHRVRPRLPR